jgi:Permuted papain-like amidase enzyme, YaeF/YiiX, C92 family
VGIIKTIQWRRKLPFGLAGVVLLVLLFYPDPPQALFPPAGYKPFTWDRAELFSALEKEFIETKGLPIEATAREMKDLEAKGERTLAAIEQSGGTVPFNMLTGLETVQFHLAALAAAHESLLSEAQDYVNRARIVVLRAARRWPVDRSEVHEAIYRVVYGGRAAVEEALAQNPSSALPSLMFLENIPSETPSTMVYGVEVHSGDIVLSRGGAPTSALIARGNDFPGNFSHAALVHVDSETGTPTVIEAHIERGSVLSTLEEYLQDKKLRILLLRLRPEHPVLKEDPMAPHRAASDMLARVRAGHIPYDFAMDWNDPARFFCSEVPYHAYRGVGIDLWAYHSRMSSPGLVNWLGSMGVRQFTTIVPSDLEYDPRIAAVAEWRNIETLRQDRLDNVMIDTLIEDADRGDRLGYAWYRLPVARMVKAWSWLEMSIGIEPVIPEGMSASTALRVQSLSGRIYPVLRKEVEHAAVGFKVANGYEPPYWDLMNLARSALSEHRLDLYPALSPQKKGSI